MKILAFSDLHRNRSAAEELAEASIHADILVGAGDFATRGIGAEETISILKLSRRPVVIVSGNHDPLDKMQHLCADWADGHLLHGSSVTLKGVTFFGLGFEIPMRTDADWNQTLSEEEASDIFADCPKEAGLVTHTPPFGYGDLQRDGTHEGSVAVLDVIKRTQPVLNLCGHIHNSWGANGHIGKTLFHNLGPTLNWFEI